ncbi:MAG: UDP-glucose 4-epimerase, partial [Gemmatimonadaceae bacterium]
RAFNIGTGVETDVVTLARVLKDVSGGTSNVVHAPARAGEQRRSSIRNEKAARLLSWRPRMTLQDGLRDTYQWFTARRAGDRA